MPLKKVKVTLDLRWLAIWAGNTPTGTIKNHFKVTVFPTFKQTKNFRWKIWVFFAVWQARKPKRQKRIWFLAVMEHIRPLGNKWWKCPCSIIVKHIFQQFTWNCAYHLMKKAMYVFLRLFDFFPVFLFCIHVEPNEKQVILEFGQNFMKRCEDWFLK